jgi:4-amino-4-deoxy-L-arabinose transferase-like glycosyltransferase
MGSLVLKIKNNPLFLFLFFLIVWTGLNFFSALLTEIHSDEAYYFLYGENLAWGYFDHPPMVGLIIYLSKLFFNGNLSIRFMTILLQAATLLLCWKIVEDKLADPGKVLTFFIISASLVMFQAYGFITTPDAPFLFFTAFFLLSYKKFLEKESWIAVLLLASSMAGLIYSKYHAFLLIGLILLSNLKLLSRYKFWFAGILALLLLAPHIYWQVSEGFPSVKYHLSDRNNGFEWQCFLGYIPNQMAVFNPLTLGAAVYIMFKDKAKDTFERGLYFLIIGFIGIFWVLSMIRYVEPHWTIACSIPVIVLVYRHSLQNDKLLRFVKRWISPTILLILAARIVLAFGLLPERLGFSGKEKKCKALESVAGNLPVVFTGSFQLPSTYHFFTHKPALLLSAANTRYTQFDFLQKELAYQGKPVFICVPVAGKSQQYKVGNQLIEGYVAEHFQSVNRVKIEFELTKTVFYSGDTLQVDFEIINLTGQDIDFQHPEFPVTCRVGYGSTSGKRRFWFLDCELNEPIHILQANSKIKRTLKTIIPDLAPNNYQFLLTLTDPVCSARNSLFVPIEIKEKR